MVLALLLGGDLDLVLDLFVLCGLLLLFLLFAGVRSGAGLAVCPEVNEVTGGFEPLPSLSRLRCSRSRSLQSKTVVQTSFEILLGNWIPIVACSVVSPPVISFPVSVSPSRGVSSHSVSIPVAPVGVVPRIVSLNVASPLRGRGKSQIVGRGRWLEAVASCAAATSSSPLVGKDLNSCCVPLEGHVGIVPCFHQNAILAREQTKVGKEKSCLHGIKNGLNNSDLRTDGS